MVTSSAVVGSSAMISFGIAGQRRWRSSRAGACRRRAGAGTARAGARASVMPTSRSSSSARSRACASVILRWMSSGSMICSPIERTGLSEVIGSWKIMAISRPRTLAHLLVGELEQIAALEQDAPADDAAGGLGEQPHDGQRRHRLAAAGLAHDGDDLAAVDGVGNAVDRAHDAARRIELDVEVLHLQQRCIRSPVRTVLRQCSPWPCGRHFLVCGLGYNRSAHALPPAPCGNDARGRNRRGCAAVLQGWCIAGENEFDRAANSVCSLPLVGEGWGGG